MAAVENVTSESAKPGAWSSYLPEQGYECIIRAKSRINQLFFLRRINDGLPQSWRKGLGMGFSSGCFRGDLRRMPSLGVLAVLCLGMLMCAFAISSPALAIEGRNDVGAGVADMQIVQSYVGYIDGDTQEYITEPGIEAGQALLIERMQDKVQLLATVVWSSGTAEYAEDAGVSVTWVSSDPSVAIVSKDGVVTPVGYGTVTVTMKTSGDFGASESSIDMSIGLWDGPFLEELVITDGNGSPLDDQPLIFSLRGGQKPVQLQAEAHYSDGTTKRTAKGEKIAGLYWSTSSSEFGEVNSRTGLLSPRDPGSNTVEVTAPTGRGGNMSDHAYFATEGYGTGQFSLPSATITIHIVYDSPDGWVERSSETYSGGDLAAMWLERYTYTQMIGSQSFMTVTARGVRVAFLLGDQGVNQQDVERYYVSTIDGANKVSFSTDRINEMGYYFPNADFGWANGAQAAPAMIAIESYCERNGARPYYGDLDPNARFHLVTGSKTLTHRIDEQPLGGICDFYVLMKGEPPAA